MKILKFKTNIADQDAVSRIAPLLDKEGSIENWEVDTDSEENILSVSGKNVNPQQVENAVQQAGFEIEVLRVLGIGGEEL